MAISLTPIKLPRRLLVDPVRVFRVVENALTGTALAVKVDFDTTTRTWKDRPKFTIQRSKLRRLVSTTDDVYRFVSRGTRVRYAVMSDDFRPKTRVGYLGSNKGRGGMVGFTKRPLPGIQARQFEETVKKKWDKEFPRNVQRAIDAEVAPR